MFISHNPECIDNSLVSITYIRYLAFFVFNISLLEEYLLGGKYVIVHYTSTYFARKRPNFYVVMANLKPWMDFDTAYSDVFRPKEIDVLTNDDFCGESPRIWKD